LPLHLHVESFASTIGQRCIKYKGCVLWSTNEVKGIALTQLFVAKLKQFLNERL